MAALAEQLVDADGNTPSRAPGDLAEILILLIWTARLLEDADQHAMGAPLQAIVRAPCPAVRPLRLGDGAMARFNGGGASRPGAPRPGALRTRLRRHSRGLPLRLRPRASGSRLVVVMARGAARQLDGDPRPTPAPSPSR